ncbi:MAG TPA: histidine phosphatase family protein [Thermomicrobiales bacterium]|nr:histidine phosphatase family protein [Thermomicrobiales bacterium]
MTRIPTTRLVIVRHGQTAANAGKLLHGWTDLPLDDTGKRQAMLVARRIANEIDAQALISSPLARARATAGAISDLTGLEVDERPELREMHFGDLEGVPVERLQLDFPEIAAQALDPHNLTLQWPNGDHLAAFYRRSRDAFSLIAEEHQDKTVVVVAHGGVIGGFLRSVAGEPLNAWQTFGLRNCALSIVEVTGGRPSVIVSNDCAHLDDELEIVSEPVQS